MMNKKNDVEEYRNLQSAVFGHRFKQSQTIYEYLLEFLTVAFSEKKSKDIKYEKNQLFPIGINSKDDIEFYPKANIGLKRFVFFDKSKLEGRFEIDKKGYEKHIEVVKDIITINSDYDFLDKNYAIDIIQNLLYSFSAVTENRSWFAQSLLPICQTALTTEAMGKKNTVGNPIFIKNIDKHFETNRYSFMCRGGEVYYLHLLNAINNNLEYKDVIESGFKKIIDDFHEFELLCNRIQQTWDDERYRIYLEENHNDDGLQEDNSKLIVKKTLGYIPEGFESREEKTLKELKNILNSDMHPFEKIDILATGIIIQIIIMTYRQARFVTKKDKGYLIFDVDCYKGKSNEEVKKIATLNYNNYNQDILDALYSNVSEYKNKDKKGNEKSEEETVKDAIEDTVKVYKKIGKNIGIVRPINEKSIRFTLNEKVLKFMVLSTIKPNTKMTFDRFLEKLYEHFGIIIGKEKLIEVDSNYNEGNLGFLDLNKEALQIMLKDCGFLRELSDSTAIIENPYREVSYEEIY